MRILSALIAFSCVGLVMYGCGGSGSGNDVIIPKHVADLGGFISSPSTGGGGSSGNDGGAIGNLDFSTGGGSTGCGSVTSAGSCSGTSASYCDTSTDTVTSEDCSLLGEVCDASSGQATCTASTGGGGSTTDGDTGLPCTSTTPATTYAGSCSGAVLTYCDDTGTNDIFKYDCAADGYTGCMVTSGNANCY